MSIGLEHGIVRLAGHDPGWAGLFEAEKARLQAALGGLVLAVEHVGSTAIPGIPAKPIIDIGAGVENFERAAACIPALEGLGYQYRGENGIPRRHYFVLGEPRRFHLHMLETGSKEWSDHLLFRDFLRRDRQAAAAYGQLKRALAERYPHDREAYQAGKTTLIEAILEQAGRQG